MAGQLGSLNILLGLDTRVFTDGLDKSSYQAQQFARRLDRQFKGVKRSTDDIARSIGSLKGQILGLSAVFVGGLGAREIIRAADAYGQMSSRLKSATRDSREFSQVQSQLQETANLTYKSFDDAAELFIRTSAAMRQMGFDAKKTADFVSTIQFGLTLDSASPEKVKSATDAISKSILQGKVNMDAFNTIVAASPTLFQALADSIANGSQKALRQMVAEGKVTADQLVKVTDRFKELRERVEGMPTSVGDAFVKLQNNINDFIGKADEANGITSKLVGVIDKAAENVDVLAAAMAGYLTLNVSKRIGNQISAFVSSAAAVRALYKEYRVKRAEELASAVSSEAAAKSQAAVTAATTASTASQNIFSKTLAGTTVAMRTLSVAAKGLNVALAAFGGIPGLIITGVSLAAASLLDYSKSAIDAKIANDALGESMDNFIQKLSKMSDLQLQSTADKIQEQINKAREELEDANKYYGNYTVDNSTTQMPNYIKQIVDLGAEMSVAGKKGGELHQALVRIKDAALEDAKARGISSYELEKYRAALDKSIVSVENSRESLADLGQRLDETTRKREEYTDSTRNATDANYDHADSIGAATQAGQEYLAQLMQANDEIGLTSRQLAELEARRRNASVDEQKLAGAIAEEGEAYKELEKAVRNKDVAAQVAAQNHINALAQEIAMLQLAAAKVTSLNIALANGKAIVTSTGKTQNLTEGQQKAAATALQGLNQSQVRQQQIIANTRVSIPRTRVRSAGSSRRSSASGAKQQESEIERLVKSLREEQDQLGMTRLEQQYYKIEKAKGSAALKEEAKSIAANISARKEQIETDKQARLLQADLQTERDRRNLEVAGRSLNSRDRDYLSQQLDIQRDYNDKIRELEENQASESNRISDEAYAARKKAYEEYRDARLADAQAAYDQLNELDQDWVAGVQRSIAEYVAGAKDIYSQLGEFTQSTMEGLESTFTDFVTTGKANWKDLIDSMIKDLMRFAVKYAVIAPIFNGIKGWLGGGGITYGAGGALFNPIGKATGGYIRGPGTGTSDSIPAWLSNGEGVLTAREVQLLGGQIGFERLRRAIRQMASTGPATLHRNMLSFKNGRAAFASGGIVGKPTGANAGAPLSNGGTVNVNVIDQTSGGVTATAANYDIKNQVVNIVLEDVMRGGRLSKAIKGMP